MFSSNVQPKKTKRARGKEWECHTCGNPVKAWYRTCPRDGTPRDGVDHRRG